MDQFMEYAVTLAAENVRQGGEPFGAVLVKDNKQVAEGVNEVRDHFDITAHAEMQVIRKAQEMLHAHSLDGYIMYASGEPCPMCLTAMYYAGIDTIYYCNTSGEAADVGLGTAKEIYEELQKPDAERTINIIHMPLNDDQEDPMQLWQKHS